MILLSYPILGGLHGYWALAKGCLEGLVIRLINLSFTVFERLQKALYSFYLRLFKVYFLREYLGSPEKHWSKLSYVTRSKPATSNSHWWHSSSRKQYFHSHNSTTCASCLLHPGPFQGHPSPPKENIACKSCYLVISTAVQYFTMLLINAWLLSCSHTHSLHWKK